MTTIQSIDELARRLAALVPADLARVRDDLATTFRSTLQAGLRDLDLVTREEFDTQAQVLARTRVRLEELEKRVAELEQKLAAPQA